VCLVDLCLSPIGFAVAFVAVGHPAAALITLPLTGLLMFFARERRARMETAVELSGAYRGTALLLGDVVEADDAYTRDAPEDGGAEHLLAGRRGRGALHAGQHLRIS
jgi:hypothetical protein